MSCMRTCQHKQASAHWTLLPASQITSCLAAVGMIVYQLPMAAACPEEVLCPVCLRQVGYDKQFAVNRME